MKREEIIRVLFGLVGFVLMIVAIPLAVVYRSGPDWFMWSVPVIQVVGFLCVLIAAIDASIEDEIACKGNPAPKNGDGE